MSYFLQQLARQPSIERPALSRSVSKMDRSKISGPVKLLSTTNMLSYTAPPVPRNRTTTISASSQDSDDHVFETRLHAPPSPPTSPEPSQDESSPKSLRRSRSLASIPPSSSDVPPLPARSNSRTRWEEKEIPRGYVTPPPSADRTKFMSHELRQLDNSSPTPAPLDTSPARWSLKKKASLDAWPVTRSATTSVSSVSTTRLRTKTSKEVLAAHPFGPELAKVDEIAEHFGLSHQVREEEEVMRRRGLIKWTAEDYTREIGSLLSNLFSSSEKASTMPLWI